MKTRSGRIRLAFIIAVFTALVLGPGEWTFRRPALAQGRVARPPVAKRNAPATPTLARRPPWIGSRFVGTPDPPSPYTAELAFPYLKFEFPLVMARAAGTRRLLVGDLKGKVWSFPDDPGCRRADLVVDLAKSHPDFSALYGLAFHPKFEQNRYVHLCYVLKNNLDDGSFVSRFEMSATDPPAIDPRSEKVLIRFWSGGHNGGCLDFGNDGYLYISTGDGADPSPPDSKLTGQDCTDLLSSILRIDVDHEGGNLPYKIPADNPFLNTQDVRPEIWAFGFRNPWKMSIDHATGDLWVGDVGWELWEMIYRVERGGNYGWSIMEGPQPVRIQGKRGPAPISPPVIAHAHSEAASITGGYVYHGSRLPELANAYIYGDYQTGTVWGLKYDGKKVTWSKELARTPLHLVAFGESNDGELYLIDHDRTHQIYRLVPNSEARAHADFPRRLSQTGLFSSTREHVPAAGVVRYLVNVPLWSDGTAADRFLAIPGRGRISLDEKGNWRFPEGSVLGRTVSIETERGKPESRRRIETQILHLEAESWRPYTYAWADDQSDAVLADAKGASRTIAVADPEAPGGKRTLDYRIHARVECILCHNPWVEKKTTMFGPQSASPLGLNTAQMNRECRYGERRLNQLIAFNQMGLLAWTPTPNKLPRLANPYDESGDPERRARAYLQVNCSHCHQFNAGGTANVALGIEVPLSETKTVGVRPIQGTFNIPGARVIAPGEPERSVLYYRISKVGGGRMPRVGSNQVDERAIRLFHDWIARMRPTERLVSGADLRADADDRAALASLKQSAGVPSEARSAAIRQLASSTHGGLLLMDFLDRTPAASSLRREVAAITGASPHVEVRDLFERFVPEGERIKRLGDSFDRAELLALKGSAERGQAVFATSPAAQCKTCHKIGPVGEAVGPELSKIGTKYDKAALLEHIVEPSKTIEPQYVSYLAETKDGQVVTGVVAERTDEAVVLKDAQGKTVKIPRNQLEQLAPQARSLMPELLLRDLTAQQAADLLEFLSIQKAP
jgi:uncharacterized repeat protein (TIGR03806 family)